MSKSTKTPAETTPSLQSQMEQLTRVVEQLEDPEVSLEASLSLYEQGMKLVNEASQTLDAAEQRVAVVTADGDTQALDQ